MRIRIKIRGKIYKPLFTTSYPLDLKHNIFNIENKHNLKIRNPYSKAMKIRLFLAPEKFLSIDNIDKEIISKI